MHPRSTFFRRGYFGPRSPFTHPFGFQRFGYHRPGMGLFKLAIAGAAGYFIAKDVNK